MFGSFSKTIENVLSFSMPMIIISLVVVISLRIAYLIKNQEKFCFYKEMMMLIFIIYILCLFQVVTFQDNSYSGGNNLIPFREIARYTFGSRLFLKNVLGNVFMFFPYGFFICYFLKEERPLPVLLLVLITSITIEMTQLMIGRVFDIDDIILNVVGGLLGCLLYCIFSRIGDLCPKVFRSSWFLTILSILFFLLIIVLL